MEKRGYHLEDYDPLWSDRFETIKKTLLGVFGDSVLNIEHVGSTSVPGMRAKPIIDVLVILKSWKDFGEEMEAMRTLGYEAHENVWSQDSLLFFKTINTEHGNEKTENIHVLVEGAPLIRQFLDMRDYMRANPEEVVAYGNLKEKLARSFPDDYFGYREGKQAFLAELEKRAYAWKDGHAK